MMAQWSVHLLIKQKVGVQFPVMAEFFFTSIFLLPYAPGKAKIDRCSIYKLDATSVSCKSNGTVQEACGPQSMGQLACVAGKSIGGRWNKKNYNAHKK